MNSVNGFVSSDFNYTLYQGMVPQPSAPSFPDDFLDENEGVSKVSTQLLDILDVLHSAKKAEVVRVHDFIAIRQNRDVRVITKKDEASESKKGFLSNKKFNFLLLIIGSFIALSSVCLLSGKSFSYHNLSKIGKKIGEKGLLKFFRTALKKHKKIKIKNLPVLCCLPLVKKCLKKCLKTAPF